MLNSTLVHDLLVVGAGRSAEAARLKILVVDDEPDILDSVAMLIKDDLGADVEGASSGPAALKILGQRCFNLIVTDFRMPGMDGCEFLKAAGPLARGASMAMMTAYSDPTLEQRAMDLGIARFFPKPIEPETFIPALRQCMQTDP